MPPIETPGAGRIFYAVTVTTALGIGALQMFHVRGGFVTNYGADVLGTAWLYALFRQGRTILRPRRTMTPAGTAAFVFLGCAVSEFAQKLQLLPGIFDPLDLLAYAITVLACYGLDRRVALAA